MQPEESLLLNSPTYLQYKIVFVQIFGTITSVVLIIYAYLHFQAADWLGVIVSAISLLLIVYGTYHASTEHKVDRAGPVGGMVIVLMVLYHFAGTKRRDFV